MMVPAVVVTTEEEEEEDEEDDLGGQIHCCVCLEDEQDNFHVYSQGHNSAAVLEQAIALRMPLSLAPVPL